MLQRMQNNTLVAPLQASDDLVPLDDDFPATVFQLALVAVIVNPLLWVPRKALEMVLGWETHSTLNASAGVLFLFDVIVVVYSELRFGCA